jgi:hypothetical protein
MPSHCRGRKVIRVTHGVQELVQSHLALGEALVLVYVRAELEGGGTAVGRWDGKEFRWITWA